MCVCLHVYAPLKLLITNGMIWPPHDWLNKFYSFYVAGVVGIVIRHGFGCRNRDSVTLALYLWLSSDAYHDNQPNRHKQAQY